MTHPLTQGGSSAASATTSIPLPPLNVCQHRHAEVLADNAARTAERVLLTPLLPDPEAVKAIRALEGAAQVGHFRAAFWSAAVGLARLGVLP